jgi:hypothetical protein
MRVGARSVPMTPRVAVRMMEGNMVDLTPRSVPLTYVQS